MSKKILPISSLMLIFLSLFLLVNPPEVKAQVTSTPTPTLTPTSTPTPTTVAATATPTSTTSAELPETGVLTPTFFLIAGGILVLFSAALLII